MSAPTYDTRCFDAASGRELYTEAGYGPHGRVVRLIETAADGQTLITAQMTAPDARKIAEQLLHYAHVITDATTQGERR
ncbi:hypothetical protein Y710_06995 [Gordonia sp. QH-12]|uniref:hypothetical protein n=1 Tax=Gordonia sp. QH-12 TaxID=1437876 RepID=UPI0007806713|nr:hypothetical protein [Gordonia sp. QH-12]KXT57522.1 hypothetical protein Y710_06995 [Gordonia sp. QH-12]